MTLGKELSKAMEVLKTLYMFPIWVFDQGGYIGKFIVTMITATVVTQVMAILDYVLGFIGTHIFSDMAVIRLFLIAFTVDFMSGIWKHLKLSSFDVKVGIKKVLEKGFICLGFMMLGNALGETIDFKGNIGGEYVKVLFYVSAVVYVAISASANFYIISNGKFPPKFIMRRLKGFYNEGDINKLK